MTVQIKNCFTGKVIYTHSGKTLENADLSNLDLYGANLRGANLEGANLRGANLEGANLEGANLEGASLEGANLKGADLKWANLHGANLIGASLEGADLNGANLEGADLNGANLEGANLKGADLKWANLKGSNLKGSFGLAQFVIVPEGAITGYKKTTSGIVVLEIPRSARRVNAYGSRKCRAEYAVVVSAPENAVSKHDNKTLYQVGQTVRPDSYDPDPRVECSHGIHFFLTREEAEEY